MIEIFSDRTKKSGKTRNYMFTSKSQSQKGIMSTVCGVISLVSFVIVLLQVFEVRGAATSRMGAVGLMASLFAFAGCVLGVMSLREHEKFQLFPRVGMGLSLLAVICWGFTVFAGTGSVF